MHTHDLENHDNLYADEGAIEAGETNRDAQSHAMIAIGALLALVSGLGIFLILQKL